MVIGDLLVHFQKTTKSPAALFKSRMASVKKLPHCQFKRVDPGKIDVLMTIIAPKKPDGTEDRPALLSAEDDAEEWMLVLTKNLVKALAAMDKDAIKEISRSAAEQWSEFDGLDWSEKDSGSVIKELSALAKAAIADKKNVYLWMRL